MSKKTTTKKTTTMLGGEVSSDDVDKAHVAAVTELAFQLTGGDSKAAANLLLFASVEISFKVAAGLEAAKREVKP